MTFEVKARRRCGQAADNYRPAKVRLLLVAEAPASDLDRYFYVEDVHEHDGLFATSCARLLAEEPSRSDKPGQLARLRDCGVFLIDLKRDAKDDKERLEGYVYDL